MTDSTNILAGLVKAAEAAVARAEQAHADRRADAQTAGAAALSAAFGIVPDTPPAHTPGTSPSTDEVAAIRADLAALVGATEPGAETPPAEPTDADLTASEPGADSVAEGPAKAPVQAPPASSSPATDDALRAMLND